MRPAPYVDDATGRLMELRFGIAESTFAHFAATRAYLERFGKPVAFYGDQVSVFRVTPSRGMRNEGLTQLGRALSELNIDIICANTPQAKGRVERAHLTLQTQGDIVANKRLGAVLAKIQAEQRERDVLEEGEARTGHERLPLSSEQPYAMRRDVRDLSRRSADATRL